MHVTALAGNCLSLQPCLFCVRTCACVYVCVYVCVSVCVFVFDAYFCSVLMQVNPSIKFEVFIHKVDGLTDDHRIGKSFLCAVSSHCCVLPHVTLGDAFQAYLVIL